MFTAAASPPVSPLSIPHHAIPQQCLSEEDTPPSAPPCSTTSLWPPATAPSLPEANPTRAWPSTSVKQWYLKAHGPSQEDLLHLLTVRNGTNLENLPEFWAGTPGDTYRDRHGREKGLGKLLGRSLLLKGKNTVVALGITILILQLCLSPFGAFPALPV